MEIEGNAAVVTGGGTGVGRATALALARRGCHVLVNYSRSKDEAEQAAAEISELGVRDVAVQADAAKAAVRNAEPGASGVELQIVAIVGLLAFAFEHAR